MSVSTIQMACLATCLSEGWCGGARNDNSSVHEGGRRRIKKVEEKKIRKKNFKRYLRAR